MEKENKYNPLNFYTLNGIKVYDGTTKYNKEKLNKRIEYYKELISLKTGIKYNFSMHDIYNNDIFSKFQNIENNIFTPLIPSTITIKGKFSNILFNEEKIIKELKNPTGNILKIGCNYGELININPTYKEPPPKVRLSNRGRKPKIKKVSKRKVQGTGKYFSSQITFEIYNSENYKIYKIKLFRNGAFGVSGVSKPDMSDLITPINILQNYLTDHFENNIKAEYFISVMRNYICKLKNPNQFIRLNELEHILKDNEKNNILVNDVYKYLENDNN